MRKVFLVPNFVTAVNLFCGFYSIIASVQGEWLAAAWSILAAILFDMLDGRIARLAKATSNFGVQFDSMSDLTSFGMAPAVLVYVGWLNPYGRIGWLVAFLFLASAALRLARFNVYTGTVPRNFFLGLPSPAAAGAIATFVIFNDFTLTPFEVAQTQVMVMALTTILAGLMISTIPFPSFKDLNWRSRASFGLFAILVLCLVLIVAQPEVFLFVTAVTYIGLSLVYAGVRRFQKLQSTPKLGALKKPDEKRHE